MGRPVGREHLIQWLAGAAIALAAFGALAREDSPAPSVDAPTFAAAKGGAGCADRLRALLAAQPWPLPGTHLRTARCLVRTGDTAGALAEVRHAISHPAFREHDNLVADPDLAPLHESPEWPGLVEQASSKAALPEPMGSGVHIAYMRRHPPRAPPRGLLDRTGPVNVVLVVWVAPDASPAQVDFEESSGFAEVDARAVAAAGKWRYLPAHAGGETFGYPMRIPVRFDP